MESANKPICSWDPGAGICSSTAKRVRNTPACCFHIYVYQYFTLSYREQFTFKSLHSKKIVQFLRIWYKYSIFHSKNCCAFWSVAFSWSCVANCFATPVKIVPCCRTPYRLPSQLFIYNIQTVTAQPVLQQNASLRKNWNCCHNSIGSSPPLSFIHKFAFVLISVEETHQGWIFPRLVDKGRLYFRWHSVCCHASMGPSRPRILGFSLSLLEPIDTVHINLHNMLPLLSPILYSNTRGPQHHINASVWLVPHVASQATEINFFIAFILVTEISSGGWKFNSYSPIHISNTLEWCY